MPPSMKSAWTLSSWLISLERGCVAETVGLRAFDDRSDIKAGCVARLVGGEYGSSRVSLRIIIS